MLLFDALIALALLVALPADALWRSRRGATPPARMTRYARSIAIAAVMDVLLAARWLTAHRTAAALGLGWPPPMAGWIGLAIAAVLIVVLTIVASRTTGRPAANLPDTLPRTASERRVFVAMALVIGTSWEILYRGFRLALIDGGRGENAQGAVIVTPMIAKRLIDNYVAGRPLSEAHDLAASILHATIVGYDDKKKRRRRPRRQARTLVRLRRSPCRLRYGGLRPGRCGPAILLGISGHALGVERSA